MTGKFITIEGIDGSGKTTAIKVIEDNFNVEVTREPSPFWTGEQLRKSLQEDNPPFVDFFLFMADRHIHIEKLIKPTLEKDINVVSDRFLDSTYAYQKVQLKNEMIDDIDLWMTEVMAPWIIYPDLTIFLDISVDTALERSDRKEKFENREFLEQVKENYLDLFEKKFFKSYRFEVIDAEQSKSQVQKEIIQKVQNYI